MFVKTVKCMPCKQVSNQVDLVESIQRFKNGTFHIRGNCPKCGTFIKYIPYADSITIKFLIRYAYENNDYAPFEKNVIIYDDKQEQIY